MAREQKLPDYWSEACVAVSGRCPILRRIIFAHPRVGLRQSPGAPFKTLARAIVGQQISVKAAQTIWDRTLKAVPMTPASVLLTDESILRDAGNSRQKIAYLKDLADAILNGRVHPRQWLKMTDDEVITDLTAIKGIGRWTAEMYLIFSLMRPNVFPVGDRGLVRAIETHFHGGAAQTLSAIDRYRERWHPWNTVATWYLWRSLDPQPVEY